MDQINSLWKSPMELIRAVGQAMDGKTQSIDSLEAMERNRRIGASDPTMKELHDAVIDTRHLAFQETKWLCNWISELITALKIVHTPKHEDPIDLERISLLAGSFS